MTGPPLTDVELDNAARAFRVGDITDEVFAGLQARHERRQDADPVHDRSLCWCCCEDCDLR